MPMTFTSNYPPSLNAQEREHILATIRDWSIYHGLAVRPSQSSRLAELDNSGAVAITAPVTLFPSLFPRSCFAEAQAVQCAYNQLYASIAQDEPWLSEVIEKLSDVDDFIARLWKIHKDVQLEGYAQELSLGIFRSDYMIHQGQSGNASDVDLRQVEFNTIASSFGGLSSKVSDMHRYLIDSQVYNPRLLEQLKSHSLPRNHSVHLISSGLEAAHRAYGKARSSPALPLCIIFVVQDPENNVFDQVALSYHLQSSCDIPVFRLPFSKALASTKIMGANDARPLVYHPTHAPDSAYEVTTLYFRAGYAPADYRSSVEWEARLHLERSAAIKCPSVLLHLAGSKKIQQILASPSSPYLNHFLSATPYQEMTSRVESTFAAIYPLDSSEEGRRAITIARDETESRNYVLKPQREGGGNNIYGSKIPPFLATLGDDEAKYAGHILMELIEPPSVHNTIYRNGETQSGEVINELGIFGVCLWRADKEDRRKPEVLVNQEAGFLLRTKGRGSEEGGVAAGFGAIDSPLLVDF